jgi:hypothetical protein
MGDCQAVVLDFSITMVIYAIIRVGGGFEREICG